MGENELVELDWSVPHGAIAARYQSRGAAPAMTPQEVQERLRLAGLVQTHDEFADGPDDTLEEGPEVGKFAPAFKAITFDGKMVDLIALQGKKIWLIFYRYATCPLCNLHLSFVSERYNALKRAGLEVVVVFESAVPAFYRPGKISGFTFPVISDPKKKLYKLYGTRRRLFGVLRPEVAATLVRAVIKGFKQGKIEGSFDQLPSHFLIDEHGVIQRVHHGSTAVDHLSWTALGVFAKIPVTDLAPPKSQQSL